MLEGLNKRCCNFFVTRLPYFYTPQHSPHPLPNFYRGRSNYGKFGLDLSHHSSLSCPHLATNRYQTFMFGATVMDLSVLPILGVVWSTPFWGAQFFKSAPYNNLLNRQCHELSDFAKFGTEFDHITIWHPIYCKGSRSRGQKTRSQCDVMWIKTC